jgi:hypothetical protein
MIINNLKDLQQERKLLQTQADAKIALLKNDLELLKNEFKPLQLFNRASEAIVPEPFRRSKLINAPINFIARTLFKENKDVVSGSDSGTGNQVRNIALSILETTATYLLTKYIRNKF